MDGLRGVSNRYDAVVVGARCAGAATAMLLARRGLRVLAVDRGRYGADTLSTHALMRGGVLQLHRWGILEAVRAAGTPPVRSTSFRYGDEEITIPIKPRDGIEALYAPRRALLDRLLVDAAAEAGAEVRHEVALADLIGGGGRPVEGVVLRDLAGGEARIEAGIVIGADGVRSSVARLAEAALLQRGLHASAVVFGYWRGLDIAGYRWDYRPGISAGIIPTDGGETCVFVSMPPRRYREEVGGDATAAYHRGLAEVAPDLAAALAGRRPSGGLRRFPGQPGHLRQAWGPGWALVGDAGYFKDPLTAHGMTDALRDAELLARAVTRGTEAALAEYQDTRDNLSRELFEITDAIASFGWDLPAVKELHLDLSREMSREVDMLRALRGETAAAA